MNPEQHDFDSLRRLLKLKRYEQPPPRYFNDFSRQVVARIRAGEAGGRETAMDNRSWLVKLWSLIEAKPILPGAFGAAICALLVFGLANSDKTITSQGSIIAGTQLAAPAFESAFSLNQNQAEGHMAFTSTNPVISLGGSLFDQIRGPVVVPQASPVSGPNTLIPFRSN